MCNLALKPLFFSLLISFLHLFHHATSASPPYFQCSSSTYTLNTTYRTNLNLLLSSLSSKASANNGFYNTTIGENQDQAYGLALCRGDMSSYYCQKCLDEASVEITMQERCPNNRSGIIWYDNCTLHYSDQAFFGQLNVSEMSLTLVNTQNTDQPYDPNVDVRALMYPLAADAPNQKLMFAADGSDARGYGLVQCTRDISVANCKTCLGAMMNQLLQCCEGKRGWRMLGSSCMVRYEAYKFFSSPAEPPVVPPAAPPDEGKKGKNSRVVAIGLTVTFVGLVLLGCCIFYLLRRRRKTQEAKKQQSHHALLNNLGATSTNLLNTDIYGGNEGENQELPFIDFGTIQHSTNNFSFENKLGQGGFGTVYKGMLVDGKEIAVKRLSIGSSQGLMEFRNEVVLISKLQHKNLVRLLFCCMEKEEKVLVYEYMPNKSLDFFLFDQIKRAQLTWRIRHNIVNGVARGLLYLHEDSRLKVIHRDLKASNVLLDYEMNPKISDFGLARTFKENQGEANTKKVIGTYGYMAPEYAMDGLFSVKSDVFSFGVLLLEILSGRKNSRSYIADNAQSLLAYAWRLWCDEKVMELIDPILIDSCPMDEVLRFVHIGLLCIQEDATDRPTMSSVVLMLRSNSMTLPHPTEPPLYIRKREITLEESSSNPKTSSNNEVTISVVEPRDLLVGTAAEDFGGGSVEACLAVFKGGVGHALDEGVDAVWGVAVGVVVEGVEMERAVEG
ncbi:cysteine-rich receptor-like protein kinase 10 isoform X2 [Cinnamomum micranthum f. kanehirae]|uniref:non-specific serine/threonine protein kinase n=1 Tax=Cinnamomum micranthum f. kanehirae TaxID=337451 RepID=A0A3S3N4V1_9MAGN|nr:cysteine-rich receptor-like protein kinase 10 isoform X2 [Cinnamomum micranthum f. kanehirae]